VNLSTREQLYVVLLAANDGGHGVDGLRRQLEHLLRGIALSSLRRSESYCRTPFLGWRVKA
jgi:hypothetical protein